MEKEKYITPETEAVKISEADVITTSPMNEDELKGVDQDFFVEGDGGLFELF